VINPVIVEGQVHGGVAQGIAGALYEHATYSSDGLPTATTFMEYVLPSAAEVPGMVVEHMESPAPEMPLGVKGSGEAGAVGGAAVIGNAVENALREFGVEITSTPFTPAAIRGMIRGAEKARTEEGFR
jgi:carbon-monoxide dehydrogenase large subunit